MISQLRTLVDLAIKLFALGLFAAILLEWFAPPGLHGLTTTLKGFYERFLAPIRRHVRPFRLSRSAPAAIDPAPWLLLLLLWWIIHPFLMWVLS